jgi:hypothetical protein
MPGDAVIAKTSRSRISELLISDLGADDTDWLSIRSRRTQRRTALLGRPCQIRRLADRTKKDQDSVEPSCLSTTGEGFDFERSGQRTRTHAVVQADGLTSSPQASGQAPSALLRAGCSDPRDDGEKAPWLNSFGMRPGLRQGGQRAYRVLHRLRSTDQARIPARERRNYHVFELRCRS